MAWNAVRVFAAEPSATTERVKPPRTDSLTSPAHGRDLQPAPGGDNPEFSCPLGRYPFWSRAKNRAIRSVATSI